MSNADERKGMSRRAFLKNSGLTVAAATTGASLLGAESAAAQEPTVLNAELAAQPWSFEVPPDPIPESDIAATVEAEVIVVGAGIAGLAVACAAAENGAQVVVISASRRPTYRGGSNHAAYSKVMEAQGIDRYDVDKFFRRELSAAGYNVDQEKWWRFYNNSEEAMNWMIDKMEAAGYETAMEVCNDEGGFDQPMHQPAGSHCWLSADMRTAGMGAEYEAAVLEQGAIDAGATFYYQTVGKQLVREDNNTGRVSAVIAQGTDGTYTKYVGSKAIVLATGDFSNDREMMAKYCPMALPLLNDAGDAGYDNNFKMGGLMPGDGHKMGLWVGAAWQKTLPNAPMMGGGAGPGSKAYGTHTGLKVNANGIRYGNENISGSFAAMDALHQPGQLVYSIWGTNYAEAAAPWHAFGEVLGADPTPPADIIQQWQAQVESGAYVSGDTVEEVIEKLGLPPDVTLATVNRYNELAAAGVDEDFHKSPELLIPITEAPFYGASGGAGFLTVCGGLRTSAKMQVCDANDTPIPGLYNVGIMVGDFYSNHYTFRVEGNNLGANCLTFGYLTGRDIANGTLE